VRMTVWKKMLVNLAVSMAILILLSVFIYKENRQLFQHTSLINTSIEEMMTIRRIRSEMKDLGSGEHDYLKNGEEENLEAYYMAESLIGQNVDIVQHLTKDGSLQQQRLDSLKSLIKDITAVFNKDINTRRLQGYAAGQVLISSDVEKDLMDSFQQLVIKMLEDVTLELKQETLMLQAAFKKQNQVSEIGIFFTFLLFIVNSFLINRLALNMAEIKQNNQELEKAKAAALKETQEAREAKQKAVIAIEEQIKSSNFLETRNQEMQETRLAALNIAQDAQEAKEKIEYLSIYQNAILDNADNAIITADTNGLIKSFNTGAVKMLGYKADEVINKHTPSFIHDKDEVIERSKQFSRELNEEVLPGFDTLIVKTRKGLPNTNEWTFIRKNGTRFPVLICVTRLQDARENVFGYLAIASDISDLKAVQNKLTVAMNVKSEFTSMVSHELRTPLTVIKESVAIVYDETAGPINAVQKDFLESAKRNVDRLGRLINDVLDYQKLESNFMEFRMKEQSINTLVEEVGSGFKKVLENKGIELKLQLQPDLPMISFDNDKITQVLTNLTSNALKFTDHGTISLITEMQGANAVKVSVKDQGIGIKPEDLNKLFKSFSQISTGTGRQTGGTGLGLALCKKIIEQHNGRVGVDSVFGQGSTFSFILPIWDRRISG
jgi:PAS domain S-box-containing protein